MMEYLNYWSFYSQITFDFQQFALLSNEEDPFEDPFMEASSCFGSKRVDIGSSLASIDKKSENSWLNLRASTSRSHHTLGGSLDSRFGHLGSSYRRIKGKVGNLCSFALLRYLSLLIFN